MTDTWWYDDDQLLHALSRAVAAPDRTPTEVFEAARAVFTWRTVDAELAELVHDSATRPPELAGLRAEEADLRTLSFEAPDLTIELGVAPAALLGQLVPAEPASLTLRLADGTTTAVPVDEDGCFRIAPRPRDRFTLTCETPAGRRIVTAALTL
ncbi:hypothetical protein ACWT_4768 [Actinoplanes sp. SE50]|uniref:hypothetical protein n=1 Tax=unclassified Actinoplanes TaxID=2626549 RepID=UPI00023EC129|nr:MULTISPECIES: hypothetical protein [unclassified Actinoplanes]AEV85789.1 hypothetical protein ACPL_4898 [Actinoplanes sp. SE50/110]ATO84183.1 hypothetical protein ACWT_4768 [Actinoplanes sp. SE50]SLM01593.1 hypothetical protein ACSP50_4829 [Actinoplanes sp. SE50/110]